MIYRGTIKNGVVVLEPPAALPEGTAVEVTELDAPSEGELPAFGLWRDRFELTDSAEVAQELRARVEARRAHG